MRLIMIKITFQFLFLIGFVSTYVVYPNAVEKCELGDTVKSDKMSCMCMQHNYQCTSFFNETGKVKSQFTSGNVKEFRQVNSRGPETCQPRNVYFFDSITCICDDNGRWPHVDCERIFGALPARNIIKHRCEPNEFVIIDCNVCRCSSIGKIDAQKCTRNLCDENKLKVVHRRFNKIVQIYGKCEINNWYSSSPCQFCHCFMDNKLVCSTGRKTTANTGESQPKLVACGKNLLNKLKILQHDGKNEKKQQDPLSSAMKTEASDSEPNKVGQSKKTEVDAPEKHKTIKAHKVQNKEASDENMPSTKDKEVLHIDVPKVINSLLNMALRRSSVTLQANTNCKPGTTLKKDCNVCHCMMNGKMLCSNNKCDTEN